MSQGTTQKKRDVYFRLLAFLHPYRRRFTVALLAMIAYGATDGVVPLLIRRILDDIFGEQRKEMLYALPAFIVIFASFRAVFGFLQHYLPASVGLRIVRDVRNAVNAHLLRLSPAYFESERTGSLISRVTNDSLLVRFAITDAVASILRDAVRVVALLCAALYLDPVLGLIAFIGFPLGLYPVIRFGKKVRKLSRSGQDQFGGLTGMLQEIIVGHRVVQSFSNEVAEQERFEHENARLTMTMEKAEKYGSLSGPTNEVVASFAIAGVILYGGLTVMNGVRTQGDFIAFLTAMFLMYEPLKKIGRVNNIFQSGIAAGERIFEVLDSVSDVPEPANPRDIPAGPLRVEYDRVSFHYHGETPLDDREAIESGMEEAVQSRTWAIEDISLVIEPGETLALVGMSGGGKSTIVSLLPRFYDPQQGVIRLGGIDIRELSLQPLRRTISVVSQNTFLFNDSVLKNILYGRLEASREDVVRAAQAANAHDFIMKLPEGYETTIGELGFRLSGGERARIAIARALLKDAPILVLDEATASLDSESEALVQEAIDHLMEERTVLVIAHRLATIRKANKIAVIVNGRLIEIGTHDELLVKGGEYAKLYNIQFSRSVVELRSAHERS